MKCDISSAIMVLILSGLSWFFAQLVKGIIQRIVNGSFSLEQFLASGGMPSSHSALVTCCAISIGAYYGFDSGLFALALLFAIVVMYDACHVRKSSGEQALLLNDLLRYLSEHQGEQPTEQELKVVLGHTTLQVFFGALLGLTVALAGLWLFT